MCYSKSAYSNGLANAHDLPAQRVAPPQPERRAVHECECWRLHLGCKVLGVRAGAALEDVGEAELGSGRRGTEVEEE